MTLEDFTADWADWDRRFDGFTREQLDQLTEQGRGVYDANDMAWTVTTLEGPRVIKDVDAHNAQLAEKFYEDTGARA